MRIGSWAQARREVAAILEKINADPALALAAAANPLLALQELGYDVSPTARQEIADRIRFGEKVSQERDTLRSEIFTHAARSFDLDSAEDVHAVLFDELGIGQGKRLRSTTPSDLALAYRPSAASEGASRPRDPLEDLEHEHPIIAPLVRYREIERSQPPFASPETYARLRRGEGRVPNIRLTARMKASRTPKA